MKSLGRILAFLLALSFLPVAAPARPSKHHHALQTSAKKHHHAKKHKTHHRRHRSA